MKSVIRLINIRNKVKAYDLSSLFKFSTLSLTWFCGLIYVNYENLKLYFKIYSMKGASKNKKSACFYCTFLTNLDLHLIDPVSINVCWEWWVTVKVFLKMWSGNEFNHLAGECITWGFSKSLPPRWKCKLTLMLNLPEVPNEGKAFN